LASSDSLKPLSSSKLFSDPFWNSRQQSFLRHLFRLLTSWAVVCDVWYLEPQTIQPGENPTDFANRVKAMIAKKAGLINVPWDGYLKYFRPSERFLEERRRLYASSIIARFSSHNLSELEDSLFSEDSTENSVTEKPTNALMNHSNGISFESHHNPFRSNDQKLGLINRNRPANGREILN